MNEGQNAGKKEEVFFLKRFRLLGEQKLRFFAGYLQKRTNRISVSRLKFCLVGCCLMVVSLNIVVAVKSFQGESPHYLKVPVKKISFKKNAFERDSIDENEFNRLLRVKVTMDSLESTVAGKRLRDSILQENPQLMEALHYLEKKYFKPKK